MKDLTTLSVDITEQNYRNLPLISYSMLSSFAQNGFRSIFSQKPTNAGMGEGKILDILLTGDKNTMAKTLAILNVELPSDNIKLVIQKVVEALLMLKLPIPKTLMSDLDQKVIDQILLQSKLINYGQSWNPATLIGKIVKEGNDYYRFYLENKDKQIVSQDQFERIADLIPELQLNPYTAPYCNFTETENITFHDQLKFTLPDGEYKIKGMMDRIIVDHRNKTLQIVDFKLTNEDEENFEQRILKFNYDIQAEMYNYILSEIIKEDSYFQDFEILPFKFIVIDPDISSPIVWEFPNLNDEIPIVTSYGYPRKHWKSLYKEVMFYKELSEPPRYSKRTLENNGCNRISILRNINDL